MKKLDLIFKRLSSVDVNITCDDCDFKNCSKNGHGLAAQHAYRTGHTVHVYKTSQYTITHDEHPWYLNWLRMQGKTSK